MSVLPLHKNIQQSDYGIFFKEISLVLPTKLIKYVHRDDYYIFGISISGQCHVDIDFNKYILSAGEMIFTQPGQVHRLIDAGDVRAFLLFVDSMFVDSTDKHILAEFALSLIPVQLNETQLTELKQILMIISRRIGESTEGDEAKSIVRKLSCVAIGMITEAIRTSQFRRIPKNRRRTELTLIFKELLSAEKHINRTPSHYASLMNISTVYLNEVIKDITGISVGKYIQNELILRAKRMLIYTTMNIKEIAFDLGYDDYAYFTRVFTKATGENPTLYREKNL